MHAGFLSLLFLPNLWYLYLPHSVLCFSLLILPPSSLEVPASTSCGNDAIPFK